jgi:hypothetical protein
LRRRVDGRGEGVDPQERIPIEAGQDAADAAGLARIQAAEERAEVRGGACPRPGGDEPLPYIKNTPLPRPARIALQDLVDFDDPFQDGDGRNLDPNG